VKAFVLVSGGLDSATVLAMVVKKFGSKNVFAVCVNYGQKAEKEWSCCKKLVDFYKVELLNCDLSEAFKKSTSTVIKSSGLNLIKGDFSEEKSKSHGSPWISSYVPFRNGLMLSFTASLAGSMFPNTDIEIFYGAHKDDGKTGSYYADCTEEFIEAINFAINKGTYGRIFVRVPLKDMVKSEVVKTGLQLGVPFEYTWSCYDGKEKQCGECASCVLRKEAFSKNNAVDPAEYMEQATKIEVVVPETV
jgi:7-cyano-7-deazaguanine synthase